AGEDEGERGRAAEVGVGRAQPDGSRAVVVEERSQAVQHVSDLRQRRLQAVGGRVAHEALGRVPDGRREAFDGDPEPGRDAPRVQLAGGAGVQRRVDVAQQAGGGRALGFHPDRLITEPCPDATVAYLSSATARSPPIALRAAAAIASARSRISPSCSPSTMTRSSGSVPEYRTSTRPRSPSACSACRMAAATAGTVSSSGLAATVRFTSTWGRRRITWRSSESGRPRSTMRASTARHVISPSPVVLWSRKTTCPDCSPPRLYPPRTISSTTWRSPTGVVRTAMPPARTARCSPRLLMTG